MDNPLTAIVMFTATTGGWFSHLSDTRKGVVAFLAAIALGFALGTTTVSQIGLPQRVSALEVFADTTNVRLHDLEGSEMDAIQERDYILDILEWQTCAIQTDAAKDEDSHADLNAACGIAPLRRR